MGRPRKNKDETPAISKKLLDRSRKIKRQLKEIAHDLWVNDRIIQLGLLAFWDSLPKKSYE